MRFFSYKLLVFVYLGIFITNLNVSTFAQVSVEPQSLEPNQSIEREMNGAETHRYKFDLKKDEFFQVRVEQKGVDVSLKLLDEKGNVLAAMDSPNGKEGFETLTWVANYAGSYLLEVSNSDAKLENGNYLIKRQESRIADEKDKVRVETERVFAEAIQDGEKSDNTEILLNNLAEALKGWRELGDDYLIKMTLTRQGGALFTQAQELAGKFTPESRKGAITKFEESLRVFEEVDNKQYQAFCWNWIGLQHKELGSIEKALEAYQKSFELHRQVKNTAEMARMKNLSGEAYKLLKQPEKAIDSYRQAAVLYKEAGKREDEWGSIYNISQIYSDQKQYEKAIEVLNEAVQKGRESGNKPAEALSLNVIGYIYGQQKQPAKNIEFSIESLKIYQEIKDHTSFISISKLIASTYNLPEVSDFKNAIKYAEICLATNETAPEGLSEEKKKQYAVEMKVSKGQCFHIIGLAYNSLGDKDKAIENFEKAFSGLKDSKYKFIAIDASDLLGYAYRDKYNYNKALEWFRIGLKIAEDDKNSVQIYRFLYAIGFTYNLTQENNKALEAFENALSVNRSISNRTPKDFDWEASILNSMGKIYLTYGKTDKAIEIYNQSNKILEQLNNPEFSISMVYNYLGLSKVYEAINERKKAIELQNQALLVFRQAPITIQNENRKLESIILNYIGNSLGDEPDKALNLFNEALEIAVREKDLSQEAYVLTNISQNYLGKRDWKNAWEFNNRAFEINQKIQDKSGLIQNYKTFGNYFSLLFEHRKAIEYYQSGLASAEEIGDKKLTNLFLDYLGNSYTQLSENEKGFAYYTRALEIARQTENKANISDALNNLGLYYSNISERGKSLDYYNQSLTIALEIKNKSSEANILSNIAFEYLDLGETQKALENFEKALVLNTELNDKRGKAINYNGISAIFRTLGENDKNSANFQKALENQKIALEIGRTIQDKEIELASLFGIGRIHIEEGKPEKAEKPLEESLVLARRLFNRYFEGAILFQQGRMYEKRGNYNKAEDLYQQSGIVSRSISDKNIEAKAFEGLMSVWKAKKNISLAIYFGKQSVNKYQEMRGSIRNLEKKLQDSYLNKIGNSYRELAELLFEAGKFAEAEEVLRMLKEEEFSKFVRRDPEEINQLSQRLAPTAAEKPILEKYNALADNLAKIGVEYEKLKKEKGASCREDARCKELDEQLSVANQAFTTFLKSLETEFKKTPNRKPREEIDAERSRQQNLQKWNAVSIYTLVGEDRLRVFLTTPRIQTDRKKEIKAEALNKKISAFREALKNPNVDPRPLGKELYDILIAPLQKQIDDSGAKTLLFSLDGTLRYIPIAALWDGEKYLVEKYQIVLLTSKTKENLDKENQADWKVFGGGVSEKSEVTEPEKRNFGGLPSVRKELDSIIREKDSAGYFTGKKFINETFTKESLEDNLSGEDFNVLHLATHFNLGRDDANSFLLLGNNKTLTLKEISDSNNIRFGSVDLVVLSACETAFGNGSEGGEVDSSATFFELKGAKSIIASLWSVADNSTSELMIAFYQIRRENPTISKAEALRLAQVKLLNGKYKTGEIAAWRGAEIVGTNNSLPNFKTDGNAPFAHPYYWSPFILIGNWK